MEDQVQVRLDKIAAMRAAGRPAFAERFERSHSLGEAGAGPAGVRPAVGPVMLAEAGQADTVR